MKRRWRHRVIAAGMGLAAGLALMGAKAVTTNDQEKQLAGQRKIAGKNLAAMLVAKGDLPSAEAVTVLIQRQQQMHDTGLTDAHMDYFVGVLHQDVDPLVVCRSLGIMIGLAKGGKLKTDYATRCKAEARKLYDHKEFLVRGYALGLTAALKDKAAVDEVGKVAKFDNDAWVRSQAEKVLPLLQQ